MDEEGDEIPAHYEVLDMEVEPRWMKNLASKPRFRYFCGVPLRTDNDINIGALFLIDDRPRESTSAARLKVLNTLAQNIMLHLKTGKDAHEKQRVVNMNMCMADFIAPEHRFRGRYANSGPGPPNAADRRRIDFDPSSETPPTPNVAPAGIPETVQKSSPVGSEGSPRMLREVVFTSSGSSATPDVLQNDIHPTNDVSGLWSGVQPNTPPTPAVDSAEGLTSSEEDKRGRSPPRKPSSVSSSDTSEQQGPSTEADQQRVFDRAAYLLRQGMDLHQPDGGGVVLFDTNALSDNPNPGLQRHDSYEKHGNTTRNSRIKMPRSQNSSEIIAGTGIAASRSAYSGALRERVVLAAASVNSRTGGAPSNFGRADTSFSVTLTPPELQRMCKKHPRGKIFHIPDNVGTSLFDWEGRSIMGRLSGKLYELVLMRRQFPRAKQVIFVPMFQQQSNRWTSCFAWTNSRYRKFTYEMDYLPTLSFCNLIRSEITRLGIVFADQQKSDFIGSVSHELRSPLHGILASIEFLQDTECDAFQRSCVDTMDACAHTLLDTISMVLDYNKVNTMTNRTDSQDSARQGTNMPTTTGLRQEPLFAVDTSCDVALITEEVVDGLAIGHLAKVRTNMDFDDTPTMNSTLHDMGVRPSLKRILNAMRPEVELILDIQGSTDWYYATQPGAIRRIVMNLFGNSLKYTKHGSITVSLRAFQPRAPAEQSVKFAEDRPTHVKIIVKDTGQGMAPDYLRTKIFTAFAQENAKGAGTGLGLSIVKSIVNLLHGEIDVKSIVNVGTMVTVTLPMKKTTSAISRTGIASPAGTFTKDSTIFNLQNLEEPPQTAIYEPSMEFDSFGQTAGAAAVHSALTQYLTGWFGFPVLQTWDFDFPATILIVDELHLPTLLAQNPSFLDRPSRQSIIILCANPARQSILSRDIRSGQVELICKPFGPHKLAKALNRTLEKAAITPSAGTPVTAASLSALDSLNRLPGITVTRRSGSSVTSRASSLASSATTSSRSRAMYEATQSGSARIPSTKKTRSRGKEAVAGPDAGYPFPVVATPVISGPYSPPVKASHLMGQPEEQRALSLNRQAVKVDDEVRLEIASSARNNPEEIKTADAGETASSNEDDRQMRLQPNPPTETKGRERMALAPSSAASFTSSEEPKIVALAAAASLPSSKEPKTVAPTQSPSFESTNTGALGIWDAPSSSQTRKPRLLLVDDNRLNLSLLHTFVKKRNYGEELCHLAEDGSQAVDEFESFSPDVIFMDISMPILDGIQATRQIRKLEANRRDSDLREKTPIDESGPRSTKPALVVALTGNAKSSDQAEALRSGVDVYMTKPVSFKQVGKLLDNWREGKVE